jgi:hypothetical protein
MAHLGYPAVGLACTSVGALLIGNTAVSACNRRHYISRAASTSPSSAGVQVARARQGPISTAGRSDCWTVAQHARAAPADRSTLPYLLQAPPASQAALSKPATPSLHSTLSQAASPRLQSTLSRPGSPTLPQSTPSRPAAPKEQCTLSRSGATIAPSTLSRPGSPNGLVPATLNKPHSPKEQSTLSRPGSPNVQVGSRPGTAARSRWP